MMSLEEMVLIFLVPTFFTQTVMTFPLSSPVAWMISISVRMRSAVVELAVARALELRPMAGMTELIKANAATMLAMISREVVIAFSIAVPVYWIYLFGKGISS